MHATPSWIRRTAALLLGALAAAASSAPAQAQASFHFVSEPGDFIGKGETQTFSEPGSTFSFSPNFQQGVGVQIQGAGTLGFWSLDFSSGDGQLLQPGTYLFAQRFPFNPSGVPGLSVSGAGSGCNTLTGRFHVSEIERNLAGDITKFAADFEQHCEGFDPALFGSVRLNSTAPSLIQRLMNSSQNATGLSHGNVSGYWVGMDETQCLSGADVPFDVLPYCFGDVCPCGNEDSLGGCANSTGGGATLTLGGGSTSISGADLDLFVSGLPANQPSMMLVSNQTGSLPMGNGALCLGAPLVRLAMAHADERGNIHFAPFDASGIGMVPNLAPGEVLHFQAWYRDAQGPCGAGTNFSNALHAVLKP